MPENWGALSPGPSPDFPDPVYGEAIAEEGGQSVYGDDDEEESRLVRSASIGKRSKPTLVSATSSSRGPDAAERAQRPGPQPIQEEGPFKSGTGYVENSSSSSTIPAAARPIIGSALPGNGVANGNPPAGAGDSSSASQQAATPLDPQAASRPYNRLSAIRRPPRLDIDAVRKAESRGSLTSLPDLIRRATRLAASLEKGRRPASRFDDFDGSPSGNGFGIDGEKRRSGLSDMLAAFPPPAQPALAPANRRSIRNSIREQVQSWPLPININRTLDGSREAVPNGDSPAGGKRGRRCCGLPLWGFITIIIVVLILIAAAVVIPVEFLVLRRQNAEREAQLSIDECRQQLVCANGGVNVLEQGACACICRNGFTGVDCTVVDDRSCTAVVLTGADQMDNVTVGNAIPRLLQQAHANFSIPLSGTEILAKMNAGNLSCSAENALVTFNGRAIRQEADFGSQATDQDATSDAVVIDGVLYTTITVVVAPLTTFTVSDTAATSSPSSPSSPPPPPSSSSSGGEGGSDGDAQSGGEEGTTTSFRTSATSGSSLATTVFPSRPPPSSGTGTATTIAPPTATSTVMTTMTSSTPAPAPSAGGSSFVVTEDVLDFARVAVLFVLQQVTLTDAEAAQVSLQRFFASAAGGAGGQDGVGIEAARNVTVGGGRSVDLVDFVVDLGGHNGRFGGGAHSSAGEGEGEGDGLKKRSKRKKRWWLWVGG